MYLARERKRWIVGHAERGRLEDVREFASEEAACAELIARLCEAVAPPYVGSDDWNAMGSRRSISYLQMMLSVAVSSRDEQIAIVADWYASCLADLFDSRFARFKTDTPYVDGSDVYAETAIDVFDGLRRGVSRRIRFGPDWRDEFTESLASQPETTRLSTSAYSPDRIWRTYEMASSLGGRSETGHVLTLVAVMRDHRLKGVDDEARWVDFAAAQAERVQADYGHVTRDYCNPRRTALEAATGVTAPESARLAQEFLRGYAWVTIAGRRFVDRLGGVDELRNSAAFAEVRELAYGGALLRATDSLDKYGKKAVRSVRSTLAPVLPPSTPRRGGPNPSPYLVYDAAAREHRGKRWRR